VSVQPYSQRVAEHVKRLRGAPQAAVVELALTTPGGPLDAPFAPVDPALHAAAQQLTREAGIDLSVERRRRGM